MKSWRNDGSTRAEEDRVYYVYWDMTYTGELVDIFVVPLKALHWRLLGRRKNKSVGIMDVVSSHQ
jgi:hypothetical protein